MSPYVYLAALHRLPCMSYKALHHCLHLVGDQPQLLWDHLADALRDVRPRINADIREAIVREAKAQDLGKIEAQMQALGIRVLTKADPDFPKMTDVHEPPWFLYCRGDTRLLRGRNMALVGTRRMTPYGESVVSQVVPALVQAGIGTVSGLARGVDGAVHTVTVECQGQTVAVLGTGIDIIYPRLHRALAAEILTKGGLLVSEFPLGSPPTPWHFPWRNRLIARFARATIVVEAAEGSGSFHTAEWALQYNSQVYAVPGSIYSSESQGTNKLLEREGVYPFVSLGDLVEKGLPSILPVESGEASGGLGTSRLLEALNDHPATVAGLAAQHRMSVGDCLAELGTLEIYGLAVRHGEGWVRKRKGRLLTMDY